ncbi:zf-TFIIB domain-containing protein [Singulisphaera sp. PoT]|uniref:TFIIB-type zinc ribbon-containing protein n=1 Tax=Singulisphaera sp. PoT TaxID=3411797 RepID=UPI003BF52ACD
MDNESTIVGCPVCGQRLRIPARQGDFVYTCPACRSRWEGSPPAAITHFEPDPKRRAPLEPCIEAGEDSIKAALPGSDWPSNILSLRTVVYGSGRIAREGDEVRHDVDPEELALCRRLASEARGLLDGKVNAGLGSEADMTFAPFWIAANRGASAASKIDEAIIRAGFGETIYPPARIGIQPLEEGAKWWSAVLMVGEEIAEIEAMSDEVESDDPIAPSEPFVSTWCGLTHWFRDQPEFVDAAFVAIGDYDHLVRLDWEGNYLPAGAVGTPSNYPKFFLGLTRRGSLAGISTYVVQT